MKKKLLTLLLVFVMALSFSLVANAAEPQSVTATTAISAVKKGEAYIIDVRCDAKRAEVGNLDHLSETYVIHKPVFDANNKLDTDEAQALQEAFTEYVKANKETLSAKPIYVLCNSGAGGATKAEALLAGAEYTNYARIAGGAAGKELELRYALLNVNNAVSGADAVAAIGNGSVVIIDVRNNAKYNELGYLEGSLHIPVFTEPDADGKFSAVATADEQLAQDFINATKNNETLKGKKIYILCNSGQSGARAATVLLKDAGYSVNDIYTITGGAAGIKDKLTTYRFVSGATAVKAAKEKTAFVIDVRTPANFEKGHLENSVNWPLFNDKGVTNGTDELAATFKQTVKENADELTGKDIYILCNSGAKGAQAATKLLAEEGYNTNASDGVVYTIKYGATGMDVRYAFLKQEDLSTVTGKEAVAAIGNSKILLLDVRASEVYGAGHLKGSLSLPVFGPSVVTSTKDELAVAFTDVVKANLDTFKAFEHIYILCNSGKSGAVAATVLLTDAGVDLTKVSTITGGAKGTTDDMSVPNALTYVSGAHTINTLGQEGYLVLDVRSAEKYAAGHLKGSLSLPVFDKNNKLDTDDAKALAEKFLAYVKANKADFDGKTIYILCNSGARGAAKAIELLGQAGVNAKVFTIEGGANSVVKDFFVKATAPNTGDSSAVMFYAVVMLLAVAVIAGKKQYAK